MTRFASVARAPYYVTVTVFTGMSSIVAYINNTDTDGIESDVYLLIFVVATLLCLASIIYTLSVQSGGDDEADMDAAGLQSGKLCYYLGIVVLALYRIAVGYHEKHVGTGWQATWGMLWLVFGIVVLPFTYANYRSYTTRRTLKVSSTSFNPTTKQS